MGKVIIDTNVIISAFLRQGIPYRAMEKVISHHEWIMPSSQLAEIKRVLSYPKFGLLTMQQHYILQIIISSAAVIQDSGGDQDMDSHLISFGIQYKADCVITGDFPMIKKHNSFIQLVTPREFLTEMSQHSKKK